MRPHPETGKPINITKIGDDGIYYPNGIPRRDGFINPKDYLKPRVYDLMFDGFYRRYNSTWNTVQNLWVLAILILIIVIFRWQFKQGPLTGFVMGMFVGYNLVNKFYDVMYVNDIYEANMLNILAPLTSIVLAIMCSFNQGWAYACSGWAALVGVIWIMRVVTWGLFHWGGFFAWFPLIIGIFGSLLGMLAIKMASKQPSSLVLKQLLQILGFAHALSYSLNFTMTWVYPVYLFKYLVTFTYAAHIIVSYSLYHCCLRKEKIRNPWPCEIPRRHPFHAKPGVPRPQVAQPNSQIPPQQQPRYRGQPNQQPQQPQVHAPPPVTQNQNPYFAGPGTTLGTNAYPAQAPQPIPSGKDFAKAQATAYQPPAPMHAPAQPAPQNSSQPMPLIPEIQTVHVDNSGPVGSGEANFNYPAGPK